MGKDFGFYCGGSCDLYCGIKYVLWLNIVVYIVDLFLCIVVYVWFKYGYILVFDFVRLRKSWTKSISVTCGLYSG